MELLLTLTVPDREPFDVAVTADPSAPTRSLVDTLGHQVGGRFGMHVPPGHEWAGRLERTGLVLDPDVPISAAGLLTGDVVQVGTRASTAGAPLDRSTSGARLLIVGGRLVGLSLAVPPGSHTVGRARANSIVLADPSISRTHFTLHVGPDRIEVEDAGSLNGTFVGGDRLAGRTAVDPDSIIEAGDYAFRVVREGIDLDSPAAQGVIAFNRPPRLDRPYQGRRVEIPAPPADPPPARLPWIAALVPVLLGVTLWVALENPIYLLFTLMSPAMALGTYVEAKRSGRKEFEEQARRYRSKMAVLLRDLYAEATAEVTARRRQSPEPAIVVDQVANVRPELYERSPDDADFLSVRVGVGNLPSMIDIDFADGGSELLRLEMLRHLDGFGTAVEVPALVPLPSVGTLGIGGPADAARALGRWVVLQLASQHSPAEVVLCGLVGPDRQADWDWLKWLPHTRSVTSPLEGGHLAATDAAASALVESLKRVIAERLERQEATGVPADRSPAIVVVLDEHVPVERPTLTELFTTGNAAGVHCVWIGSAPDQIPHFCGAVAEVAPDRSRTTLRHTVDGSTPVTVGLEGLSVSDTASSARRLAPVVDNAVRLSRDAGIPRSVPLVDLLGGLPILTDPAAVQHRWRNGTELRAPLGVTARGELSLDLRNDGPHGLVAGTTGAGKSELLQSLVASLAATHPPSKLTFLLVDYKGGAAFKECKDLPHTVGFVTDLNEHLTRRALTSLNAEVTRRERVLGAAGAKDLRDMERKRLADTPPNLLIVIDEFAALAKEIPEFVGGVVDVAQRGRSLGMHLLLATQRPAGVVTDNIRANTNLRVALRVAEEAESVDVIGTKAAHRVDTSTPGRAFARIGSNDPVGFQAGYVGGHSLSAKAAPDVVVADLEFEGTVTLEDDTDAEADSGDTDLLALVRTVTRATSAAGLPTPRSPLLAPLPEVIDLRGLVADTGPDESATPTPPPTGHRLRSTTGELRMTMRPTVPPTTAASPSGANGGRPPRVATDVDHRLVLGVVDRPDDQSQDPWSFDLDRDGSLLVFGAGGTGKTVLLRTVAATLGRTASPDQVHIYGLDFASRGLRMLRALPQVGDVLTAEDTEQVMRLFRTLRQRISLRRALLADAGAADLTEYRRLAPQGPEQERIVVLLDGYAGFTAAYEKVQGGELLDAIPRLVADGRSVGVHFVITGDRRNAVPSALAGVVTRRVVLRQSSRDEYANLGVDTRAVDLEAPPGRGMVDGLELQVAMLGDDPSGEAQQRALSRLGEELTTRYGQSRAPAIGLLPDHVDLDQLPASPRRLVALFGVGDDDLAPTGIDLTDTNALVAGPNRSGRTTALAAIARSLARTDPRPELHLLSARRDELVEVAPWATVAIGEPACTERLRTLVERIESGPVENDLVVIVDDLSDLVDGDADRPLAALVKLTRDHPVRVVAAGENAALRRSGFNAAGDLRKDKTGLLLQPDLELDGDILGARLPRRSVLRFPPGRGFVVRRGTHELFQVARPSDPSTLPATDQPTAPSPPAR